MYSWKAGPGLEKLCVREGEVARIQGVLEVLHVETSLPEQDPHHQRDSGQDRGNPQS